VCFQEFLEVAYEELYEKAALIDGEIYVSYLTEILEHPFVVEIIRRFTTYKIVVSAIPFYALYDTK